jgi:nitrogen fixation protein NifU and related proteins
VSYRDVFGDILADHHENPRFYGNLSTLAPNDHSTAGNTVDDISGDGIKIDETGYNPVCGDQIIMHCLFEPKHKRISKLSFEGEGCSICMASASILVERAQNIEIEIGLQLIESFREKMQGKEQVVGLPADDDLHDDLVALYGIKRFPVRIKCALLAWTTLKNAIDKASEAKAS